MMYVGMSLAGLCVGKAFATYMTTELQGMVSKMNSDHSSAAARYGELRD
jgi:hypothetical protein